MINFYVDCVLMTMSEIYEEIYVYLCLSRAGEYCPIIPFTQFLERWNI